MNLVPSQPGATPSYWCTWSMQSYSSTRVLDSSGGDSQLNNLSQKLVFEDPGWIKNLLAPVRSDLFVLFDHGWDVPPDVNGNTERWRLGSMEVASQKFPACTGSPAEGQYQLNQLVKATGWRGAGLWTVAQMVGDGRSGNTATPAGPVSEAYWRTRAQWAQTAGIEYWKIDFGYFCESEEYRRMMTRVAREEAPGLILEHAPMAGPFNDIGVPWENRSTLGHGRFRSPDGVCARAEAFIAFSDVLRIYDVIPHLSIASSLDRVAQILAVGRTEPGVRGLINCEDEPYLGAALGCALGILRHPLWAPRAGEDYNPTQLDRRIDEVVRAVRWHRLAPAYGVGETSITLDENILADSWLFKPGETWADWVIGHEILQRAPARVARGMPLPEVHIDGQAPYVVAGRHPNGATAVAALPRTHAGLGIRTPLADVTIEIGHGPVGVFGRYRSLTLILADDLGARQIWAQDVAGDQATDITALVARDGQKLTLPGSLIESVGLSAATPGDLSEPGMILTLM